MITSQKVYAMLGNESLWEVALRCERVFQQSDIPHSICWGVAVCLHGYQRNTTDVDVIIYSKDSSKVKELLLAESFQGNAERKEFRSSSGVPMQFLLAGERAGKGSDVVELIAIRKIDGLFARFLHQSVRPAFRELVRHATEEDDAT